MFLKFFVALTNMISSYIILSYMISSIISSYISSYVISSMMSLYDIKYDFKLYDIKFYDIKLNDIILFDIKHDIKLYDIKYSNLIKIISNISIRGINGTQTENTSLGQSRSWSVGSEEVLHALLNLHNWNITISIILCSSFLEDLTRLQGIQLAIC